MTNWWAKILISFYATIWGTLFVLLISSFFIISCANSDKGGAPPVVAPVPPPPGIWPYPMPTTTIGFYAQSRQFTSSAAFGGGNTGGQMSISGGFQYILQEAMGVCNREYSTGGMLNCNAWMAGDHDMFILFQQGQATSGTLVIRSLVDRNSSYYNYYWSMPSWDQFFLGFMGVNTSNPSGIYDPLILKVSYGAAGSNRGFELRANGPDRSYAYNKVFQLQVPNGSLNDQGFDFILYYNGVQGLAAQGNMQRCLNNNCGLY